MEIVNIIFKIIFCFSCGWAIASCIIIGIHIRQIKETTIKLCDAFNILCKDASNIADDNIELINMIRGVLKENRALQSKIKQLEANKVETKK